MLPAGSSRHELVALFRSPFPVDMAVPRVRFGGGRSRGNGPGQCRGEWSVCELRRNKRRSGAHGRAAAGAGLGEALLGDAFAFGFGGGRTGGALLGPLDGGGQLVVK